MNKKGSADIGGAFDEDYTPPIPEPAKVDPPASDDVPADPADQQEPAKVDPPNPDLIPDAIVVPEYLTKIFGEDYKTDEEAITAYQSLKQKADSVTRLEEEKTRLSELVGRRIEPKNELVTKLNSYLENNPEGSAEDFLRITTKDYSTMNELDVIKEHMSLFNKDGLTSAEMDLLLRKDYGLKNPKEPQKADFIVDEELDEELYNAAVEKYNEIVEADQLTAIRLKRDVNKYKTELIENQNKYTFKKELTQAEVDSLAKERLEREAALTNFEASLKDFNNINEDIVLDQKDGNKISISYKTEDKDKKYVADVFAGRINPFEKYSGDIEAFKRDQVIMSNLNRYIEIVAKQAYNKGKEDFLKSRRDIDLGDGKTKTEKVVTTSKSVSLPEMY